MKIGIASCYAHHNYGSMLQAYATQKIIQDLGFEAITIQCDSPIRYMQQSKAVYLYHKISNPDIVRKKIREFHAKYELSKHRRLVENIKIRDNKFNEFYHKYINLSKFCKDRTELENLAKTFDAVVVGSDMLWHPINVEHDYYTLSFVPSCVKTISYATSFGTENIPAYQMMKYKEFLSRFAHISVREKSGVNVIKKLDITRKACVVLDPTLLFDEKSWEIIQDNRPFLNDKYILCYFLGVNKEHRKFAEKLKRETGYKIVALQHLDEFVKADMGYADITPYNVGPSEFVNLIKHAKYVCTDSFHGSCFSILHHKDFFTFNRFKSSDTQSTNTRIDSLLNITKLTDRRINNTYDFAKLLATNINYMEVDKIIDIERKKSIDYLKNAILN